MRFSRLHLILLLLGTAGFITGIFYLMIMTEHDTVLIEPSGPVVERVSAGYSYTPIEKNDTVLDLQIGETTLISSTGQIKVNVNTSDIHELDRLPGVGPSTALRILEYRFENGPILSLEELQNVKGIGKKTIAKFGDQAYIGEPHVVDETLLNELKESLGSGKKEVETVTIQSEPCGPGRININTATAEELVTLPKIGPKIAERIIADRTANGPFKDVNDLTRVKGIGPKTLDKMKDRVCVE